MLIDWFTVCAQAINFMILVWLMKRFLYKPVLDAIDAREKGISAELAEADKKKSEAQKDRDDFLRKNDAFDKERGALLSKATAEAKTERQKLIDEAGKAADTVTQGRRDTMRADMENLNHAIGLRTRQEVFDIARRVLTDLATASLEERIGEVFTRRLREMNGADKETLGKALKSAGDPALVRSTFDMPHAQCVAIQNALNETFSAEIRVRFVTAPDLVSGIELSTESLKVGWNIAEYLASMERGVGELVAKQEAAKG